MRIAVIPSMLAQSIKRRFVLFTSMTGPSDVLLTTRGHTSIALAPLRPPALHAEGASGPMEWIISLGIGALTGLIAGLLGAGGGWIAVPALTLGLPYAGVGGPDLIKVAIASTHAINFFTSISAARAYIEKGSVHWTALFRMLPGTVIGVTGGAMIAAAVNVKAVTAIFVMAAMYMAFRMIRGEQVAAAFEPLAGTVNLSAKGLAVGGLVGIVGGGGLSVPLLLRYMPVRTAIGTAAALSVPIAVIAVLSYAFVLSPAGCPSGCLGFVYLPAVCAAGVTAVMMCKSMDLIGRTSLIGGGLSD